MYGFLYLDVLLSYSNLRRTNICIDGCIACSYSNCKENKHMYGFLYLDVLHIHTAIVRRTNRCMASFIWMDCVFIQQS